MTSHLRPEASTDAILRQIGRVLKHASFSRSRVHRRLLRAFGERLLNSGEVPATQIDFARDLGLPSDFDPERNPLVRIHIAKLRKLLRQYAEGDGRYDETVLSIPLKCYRLQGHLNAKSNPSTVSSESSPHARIAASRSVVLVSEFGPATPDLIPLTHELALRLVPSLLDVARFFFIGPLLWERAEKDSPERDVILQNSECSHFLDGECRKTTTGVEVAVSLRERSHGQVCWTTRIADPFDPQTEIPQLASRRLARRLAVVMATVPLDRSGLTHAG